MSDLRGLLRTGSEPERLAYVLGAMGAVEALQEEAEGRQTENPVRKYTNVSQLVTDYGAEHGRRGGFARAFRGAGGIGVGAPECDRSAGYTG